MVERKDIVVGAILKWDGIDRAYPIIEVSEPDYLVILVGTLKQILNIDAICQDKYVCLETTISNDALIVYQELKKMEKMEEDLTKTRKLLVFLSRKKSSQRQKLSIDRV